MYEGKEKEMESVKEGKDFNILGRELRELLARNRASFSRRCSLLRETTHSQETSGREGKCRPSKRLARSAQLRSIRTFGSARSPNDRARTY